MAEGESETERSPGTQGLAEGGKDEEDEEEDKERGSSEELGCESSKVAASRFAPRFGEYRGPLHPALKI